MSNRYPRDRSPPYRDRRPSTFTNGYAPRASDSVRPNSDASAFPPRDIPRGPKSVVDAPRGPATGPPTPLRTAPPLSSGPAPPLHNSHSSWRADRDRDRDFDRRERRPTPPRRSPIRDARDTRDQRDFVPRDPDVSRARRNSRDAPPSAASTYSDAPPLGTGSTYRGGSISRGRGGFAARGRNFHNDDRDRHHDPRDRPPDRTYRPRSRTPPGRRERDVREERDFDRRDRDDRRFIPREYDSYIGPAGAAKPGLRALDTHRGPGPSDLRHLPGTPTGPTPHASHHVSPSDRLGSQVDSYSRRSSLAIDPLSTKEPRREPGKDEALLAGRAEASRERYAPRASSPPASIPAFGGSNVWRASVTETKPTAPAVAQPKPIQSIPTPVVIAPVIPTASKAVAPMLAPKAVIAPTAPKAVIPSGPSSLPPTGPKADRMSDRVLGEAPSQDARPGPFVAPRMEPPAHPSPVVPVPVTDTARTNHAPPKATIAHTALTSLNGPSNIAPPVSASTTPSGLGRSPPQGPAFKPRAPPIAPQAAFRANASPSFSRATLPPYAARDPSPGATPPIGPRSGSGNASAVNTSPQTLPANIPTGPKADRAPMAPRPSAMYPPPDRPGFPVPRTPMGGGPKSMQWVRPGLIPARTMVPTKREFPLDDRDRQFGTFPKAPRLENSLSVTQPQREQAKSVSPSVPKVSAEPARPRERAASAERSTANSPKPTPIETRRYSDVMMADASPQITKPPISAISSAPEVLQDSDDDVDLDEDDFAESEAKYNQEVARLEAKRIDLSAPHLRATTPLQEIVLLSSLTVDHIPQKQMESKQSPEDETVPMHRDDDNLLLNQQRPGSIIADLPTPTYDRSDDVEMGEIEDRDDKLDRSTAPATMALRLRREGSANDDAFPDLSSLPYLGSGPPTPLSDIGQDRPSLSDSIRLAMREKLRKSIEPELSQDATLHEYAAVYKQWRSSIRPWDEEREQDDQERQPSAEPTLKALTPDVQSAAVTGILDGSLAPTGRRGHASRWATELDIEAVIAESLKTAEEEKLGKKDKEPRKSMADPEKEADLPIELTESEAQRRRYIDTNFQREPGQGIFAFHYEPPADDFTEEEHRVMVHNYKDQFAKKWGKLAEVLYKEVGTERTYKDCINHYYATKWGREYKGKLRGKRGGPKKRGGAVARGRAAIANMERPEQSGEDGLPLPVTETGRPRRSAAPTFGGTEQEVDPNAVALVPGRARRQTDADGTQEKGGKRGKGKDRIGRKAKNMPLAAAPVGSPIKLDRKEKGQSLGVKLEDEFSKRPLGEMPLPIHAGLMEEQMLMAGNQQLLADLPPGILERSKLPMPPARPGPSSYWSVSELQDFDKNVAHFGTDWLAIANHMGTKTHTMIKNQYLRLVESGRIELEQMAKEADVRRERGDELGPPPTPTPAPKRRYESTQAAPIRQIAPTPEHKSPLMIPLALPKASSPQSASSSRFSTIAQAPVQGKPSLPASGFPSLPEPSLVSVPSMPSQQSPPVPPQRTQPPHHHQHSMSQHKQPQHGPRAGYFSDDMPPRQENRPPSQSPANQQQPRHLQQHAQPPGRSQEQHPSPLYRSLQFSERENSARTSVQQEQEAQQRFQHQRRISHELQNHRPFGPGQPLPLMPTVRSNSALKSPEHRPLPYSHSRHVSQAHAIGHSPSDTYSQGLPSMPNAQQLPPRSAILTPPVKEEPRNPPPLMPQPQPQPILHSQHQHQQLNQTFMQKAPPPSVPKPVVEPRKSNLMSLLNDTPPEEPRRKKPTDQGPSSHSTTPQQSTPIAPPPSTSQPYPSASRRPIYEDQGTSQASYRRPSYAQQSALLPTATNRSIDITNEQSAGGRTREGWPQRPPYLHSQSHGPQSVSLPSSQPGPPQPAFNDNRMFGNHRSVFAQHNATRHNPSPPPHGYSNSPLMHPRTPSISGAPGQVNRHTIPSTTAGQHSQAASASAQILQPNPYAQVDPPGSAPPPGPLGMRPSPHLHTSHIVQQREASGRNEHSQTQNANLSYSNPQTPNEHPGHAQLGGPRGLNEPYRPRDPREPHRELDSRNSDRDMGRELAQRTEYLREQLSNPAIRSSGPPMHEDVRYQPQDRPYLPQRSQTPLSRPEHSQTPQLQHPPHSSLGVANHPLYSQRPPEEPARRFSQPAFPRDRSIADRMRDEHAQQAQQAAMNREEQMRRDRERDMHEREFRDREMQDARYRENLMRSRDMRGPPPQGSAPEQRPEQRAPTGPGPMDWNRHAQDRGGWPR